jgi:hypothetical protein
LSTRRYLVGHAISAADIRPFTALIRFDIVYADLISQIHTKNYYHEFDLIEEGGHLLMMSIQFDTASYLCGQIRAGALSSVELLSRLIARIGTFDDSINVVALSDFKERP